MEAWIPESSLVSFKPHKSARNQASATSKISAGSTILAILSFASVLLDSQKSIRCSNCFRLPKEGARLLRCTGCAAYWYCDTQCQNEQWKVHHKRVCKKYNYFVNSSTFQGLETHEKLDSLLLSHLIAHLSLLPTPYSSTQSTPFLTFLSLIPSPITSEGIPPICPVTPPPPDGLAESLYSRFGNNNFAIHSHLTTIGHGIFPLASRLFNHSCVPNAAAKYTLTPRNVATMEVVALRDLSPGEEICIPYIDPALLQTRNQVFNLTYGFDCKCSACGFLRQVGAPPKPPASANQFAAIGKDLRDFVGIDNYLRSTRFRSKPLDTLPQTLLCVLDESYMSGLSETFSRSSHDGDYVNALDAGLTLLALYLLIYPPNYPQIGMHLLEMAKTEWNHKLISLDLQGAAKSQAKVRVGIYLSLARKNLEIMGLEGDEDGPFQEMAVLDSLLGNA